MTIKTTPALLDRLENALKMQGLVLKRSQLLEVAASAFGYRNSNAMTAAAKDGDLALPLIQPRTRIELSNGESILVLRDPTANAPYAIDEAFLEQVVDMKRGEQAGITPYGHLVDLSPALEWDGETISEAQSTDVVEFVNIHIAIISHRHGNTSYAAFSEQDLHLQMYDYILENWSEVEQWSDNHPSNMSPEEAISEYFDLCNDHEIEEYLDTSCEVARLPMRLPTPAPSHDLMLLADQLQAGSAADIWYDAHQHGNDRADDPDRVAEATIDNTQLAMQKAASLLRAIASGGEYPPTKTTSALTTKADDRWKGQDMQRHVQGEPPIPDSNRQYAGEGRTLNLGKRYPAKLGVTAESNGTYFFVPTIDVSWEDDDFDSEAAALARAEKYIEEIDPLLNPLDAEVEIHENVALNTHRLFIYIPMRIALTGTTPEDWFAALSYLLLTNEEKEKEKQVTCEFTPQMDVRKYIISVDPLGDTVWDGTFDALRWGRDQAEDFLRLDPDEFARSPMAPKWVQDWAGPFVVDPIGLEQLFDL